tara:strand:- start:333 stop:1226 length:894 start_codon:yes stop_codon:yes gene_type:complete
MAQRREPAIPIFAKELSRATESYVDEDKGEYSPTYLISDMGAKLSRVLVGGILTTVENHGSEDEPNYRAQIADPTGTYYYVNANQQWQPEGAADLSQLESTEYVLCVGRVRSFTPEDGDKTYITISAESIRSVSESEVNLWALTACQNLFRRFSIVKEVAESIGPREESGITLAKELHSMNEFPTEEMALLLMDQLQNLTGAEITTTQKVEDFSGSFETASDIKESTPEDQPTEKHEQRLLDKISALDVDGEGTMYEMLVEVANELKMDTARLDETLDSLSEQGLIYQPSFNQFKVS